MTPQLEAKLRELADPPGYSTIIVGGVRLRTAESALAHAVLELTETLSRFGLHDDETMSDLAISLGVEEGEEG